MLRVLVLALLLANAGYFAWSQGLLANYGLAPVSQAEPQRLAQQIKPAAIHLLNSDEARQLEQPARPTGSAPASPSECLQAGLFSEDQAKALRAQLDSSLPAGSWVLQDELEPERWIVYMGKYASPELLAKKRSELRQREVAFEPLINQTLNPGLSLGHFSTQAEAEQAMAKAATHGVRTARVLLERPALQGQRLKLAAVDAALKSQLDLLKPQLAGKALHTCR
ncbi:hypothetical protein SAMN05216344_11314 [Polaromonas sp. OV174]|uniref:hypothetical protein n=1 Tax=Polaromonas sp. OV174 TaxID=1855300 RepID=UPI0008ED4927|nr:hypothetical protein [Polaromonas sp. OV174]SFC28529.1 hypothetical protein SAMN05216344_11314 [Polaromonas sp. OV174]